MTWTCRKESWTLAPPSSACGDEQLQRRSLIPLPMWPCPGGVCPGPWPSLEPGAQHVQELPGAFADSTPDRWGRRIIATRSGQRVRESGRTVSEPTLRGCLLEVSDLTRPGALRFRLGTQAAASPNPDPEAGRAFPAGQRGAGARPSRVSNGRTGDPVGSRGATLGRAAEVGGVWEKSAICARFAACRAYSVLRVPRGAAGDA